MKPMLFSIDTREFDREVARLSKALRKASKTTIPVATQRALNKGASKTRTKVTRELAKAVGVPQKVLRKVVKDFKASRSKLTAKVWVGLKRGVQFDQLSKSATKRTLSKPFRARFRNGKVTEHARRILPSSRNTAGRNSTGNLPIDYKVRLKPKAEPILKQVTNTLGRRTVKQEMIRQLQLALKKLNRR